MTQEPEASELPNTWKILYRTGGMAALLMAVFIPLQIIIFILKPPPATVDGWFRLFQENWLIGLIDMDLLLIIDQILVGLLLLSLYIALRKTNRSLMTIALALGFLGIAAYFASTAAFEMLSLSNKYAATADEAQKTILMAAGQVMLSTWQGTAFSVGYVIEGIALLITAMVMLKSPLFSRFTAIVGIVLGIMSLLPPTAGMTGMIFALGSLVPLEIWDLMVGIKLFKLTNEKF